MSSADYIDVPVETDPQSVLQEAYDFLAGVIPGWTPAEGNLDVWLLMSAAAAAAESRDVASRVTRTIFRWYGATLIGLPPNDATPATVLSTWNLSDTLGHTIPAGTQVTINSGDTPVPFTVQADAVVAPGASVANNVLLTAVTAGASGSGLGAIGGAVVVVDTLSFVTSVTQNAITTGGVDAETDTDYLNRLTAELQLLAPRPILPSDFAVFARNISGVYRATAIDGYNPNHNLLTANEASAETDATGWTNLANTTVAQSGAQFMDGSKSISMTAASAADMSMRNASNKTVTPGEQITATAFFRTAVTARACKVGIQWLDSGSSQISISYGSTANDTTSGWTQATVTATAPATAAFCRIVAFVTAPANAEVHYVDEAQIRRGSTNNWVAGGTSDTGNARTVAVAAIDSNGAPVSAGIKTNIQNDLQARREVNFIVNVADPNQAIIDVTYDIHILAGYSAATVIANVNAAIASYLNPATWGSAAGGVDWANTNVVRYLEIAQVINGVQGVDYITTTSGNYNLTIGIHGFTLARADITLPGVAPLPTTVGATITGTSS